MLECKCGCETFKRIALPRIEQIVSKNKVPQDGAGKETVLSIEYFCTKCHTKVGEEDVND